MKNVMNKLLVLFGIVIAFYACSNDDDQAVLSSDKEILAFDLIDNGSAEIDQQESMIVITVPFGTDVTALVPTIVVSENAMVSPEGGVAQDFTNPVTYTVTAQDGNTVDYVVTVAVLSNTESSILQFDFEVSVNAGITEDIVGTIDEEEKTIQISVPVGIDITSLVPDIQVSQEATIDPGSRVAQDFTNAVNYTVTSEDGLFSTTYQVLVNQQEANLDTDREALIAIYNANVSINPAIKNTFDQLRWDVDDLESDISTWFGVTVEDQRVVGLSIDLLEGSFSPLEVIPLEIGYLTALEGLTLTGHTIATIPPEIGQLTNLQELILTANRIVDLPIEIENLKQLTYLVLSNNRLENIPEVIWQLTNLEELLLNSNGIAELSPEIGGMTRLVDFEIGFNHISSIPQEIGNLRSLESLVLIGNELTTVPSEVANLAPILVVRMAEEGSLRFMDLRVNPLVKLPEDAMCELENAGVFISVDDGPPLYNCPD